MPPDPSPRPSPNPSPDPNPSPSPNPKARAGAGLHSSAPLAACGAVLVVLSLVGLARSYESEPTARATYSAPDAGAPEVAPLLEGRPIDLNRASAAELELLPRVGPRLAERIVEERERGGPFRSVGDLERVRGIGPRTVERIAPLATASAP